MMDVKENGFVKEYSCNRTVLADVLPVDIPFCISIETSNICNFKCVMCPHGSDGYASTAGPLQNMEQACFDKVLEDIAAWTGKHGKIKVIKLYSMGEPLVHPLIGEIVRRIKAAEVCDVLEITTNGSLLNDKISEDFIDSGLDFIRFSIYSVIEEKNRAITKSDWKPDQIREKMIRLKDMRDNKGKTKPFIHAKIIDTYNEYENEKFLKYYEGIADEVFIDKPMHSNNIGNVIEKLYQEGYEEIEKEILNNSHYSERKACRYPFTHLTVKSTGEVVVCCADWMKSTKIGNINEKSLEDIWNSRELYDFRIMQLITKGINHPSCRECDLPFRDFPEDDIDGFPIEKLSYKE